MLGLTWSRGRGSGRLMQSFHRGQGRMTRPQGGQLNGIIMMVAGNGTSGLPGDGGMQTNAELADPAGVAVDAIGNLFIADRRNQRIRKVDTNGIITTVAGNGTYGYSGDGGAATNAESAQPHRRGCGRRPAIYSSRIYDKRAHSQGGRQRDYHARWRATEHAGYSGDGGAATNAELY